MGHCMKKVPRIRENYHRVPTNPNRLPNIFLKKNLVNYDISSRKILNVLACYPSNLENNDLLLSNFVLS